MLLVVGVIVGLIASDSELANPFSGIVSVEQAKNDMPYRNQERELELRYRERKAEAELRALEEQYKQIRAFNQDRHEREMMWMDRREQLINGLLPVATAVVLVVVVAIGFGLTYWLVCAGRSRLMIAQAQGISQTERVFQRGAMRQAREEARKREREARQQELEWQSRLRESGITVDPNGCKDQAASEPTCTLWSRPGPA